MLYKFHKDLINAVTKVRKDPTYYRSTIGHHSDQEKARKGQEASQP